MSTDARARHQLRVIEGAGDPGRAAARRRRNAHRQVADIKAQLDEAVAREAHTYEQLQACRTYAYRLAALAQRHGAAGWEIDEARDGGAA